MTQLCISARSREGFHGVSAAWSAFSREAGTEFKIVGIVTMNETALAFVVPAEIVSHGIGSMATKAHGQWWKGSGTGWPVGCSPSAESL